MLVMVVVLLERLNGAHVIRYNNIRRGDLRVFQRGMFDFKVMYSTIYWFFSYSATRSDPDHNHWARRAH